MGYMEYVLRERDVEKSGEKRGRAEGMAKGRTEGRAEGMAKGIAQMLVSYMRKNHCGADTAMDEFDIKGAERDAIRLLLM